MTKVLALDVKNGIGNLVTIRSGRYAVAVCGEFDHAIVSFRVKFGKDVSPTGIERLSFSAAAMEIVELPACIVWLELSGERADTEISGVIAPVDR